MNKTVCELFLGVARGTYRGLPRLFRLSWVDQLMITRFSRYNLGGSSHDGRLNQRGWLSIGVVPGCSLPVSFSYPQFPIRVSQPRGRAAPTTFGSGSNPTEAKKKTKLPHARSTLGLESWMPSRGPPREAPPCALAGGRMGRRRAGSAGAARRRCTATDGGLPALRRGRSWAWQGVRRGCGRRPWQQVAAAAGCGG